MQVIQAVLNGSPIYWLSLAVTYLSNYLVCSRATRRCRFKLCIGIEVWDHSTQFRHVTEIAGVRNLVNLNSTVNGDRQKPPEGNTAPRWAE